MKKLKKLALSLLSVVMVLGSCINVYAADSSIAKPGYAVVSASSTVPVFQGATASTKVVASLKAGSSVLVAGHYGGFYRVMYDTNGNYGYVADTNLTDKTTDYYLHVNLTSGNLNFRSGAGTSYTSLCLLPNGTNLAYVPSSVSGWYAGVYGNVQGYGASQYLQVIAR